MGQLAPPSVLTAPVGRVDGCAERRLEQLLEAFLGGAVGRPMQRRALVPVGEGCIRPRGQELRRGRT